MSFIGAILFFACLNIHQVLKIPSFKITNFNRTKKKLSPITENKKEPIISRIPDTNLQNELHEENNSEKIKNEKNFSSPSLDILESEKINTKRKLEKENIKENSSLLERVFKDFNIEVQVMTVKLGLWLLCMRNITCCRNQN